MGAAIVLLALAGCQDAPLSPVSPCVAGETQACTVPPCTGPGTQHCLDGEWGPCEGYQTPQPERCNGRDDSCNGFIDDNPQDPEIGEPCGTDVGRCRTGEVRCIDGALTCFGAIEPRPERCNGLDDDCDGIPDNNVPEQLCYTGPPETRGVGICRSGVERCVGGELVCEFEQLPEPFDCTNGLDNTCDGQIDHADGRDVDIVLFVDWSGSMIRTLPDVRQGLITFLSLLHDSHRIRVATVVFPDEFNDGHCALKHEFVGPAEAIESVNRLEIKRVGIEPPYQCLYDAARNEYGLTFREGADRVFILFTDEPNFNNNLTQEDVAEKMNEVGAVAMFFVDPLFQHHYTRIVDLTEGTMDDLAGGDLAHRLLSRLLTQTCDM
jgi:hypothetical protein